MTEVDVSEVRRRAWKTRRKKYGERGHNSSYSRSSMPSPNADTMLALIIKLHYEEALSEGQVAKATGLDRIEIRDLVIAERDRRAEDPPSALAGTIPEITWSADDETHGLIDQLKAKLGVSTTAEVFREALRRASALAGTRPDPASPSREELIEALSDMLQAVCGETGFAACVRSDSRTAYPWPALDIAEAKARSLLTTSSAGTEGE
jgi:hypothetical protein